MPMSRCRCYLCCCCLQDGSAVAMTETVQGTYRVDPATLQTLNQVGRAEGSAEAMLLLTQLALCLRSQRTRTQHPAHHFFHAARPVNQPSVLAFISYVLHCWGLQVKYQDKIKGDLTTAHPQPMPNGDLVNLVSTVG